MSLVPCPECKAEISSDAKVCPQCGFKKPKSFMWLWGILGAVVLFLAFGAQQNSTPEGKERTRQRAGIDECRRIAAQNPGNMVAEGGCKILEDQFRSQFGHSP